MSKTQSISAAAGGGDAANEDEGGDVGSYHDRLVKLWKDRKGTRRLENGREAPKPPGPLRFKCSQKSVILDVFRAKGWKETDSETEWDIYWAGRDWIRGVLDRVHLDPQQKVNHYRNYYELTRKDMMVKNLKRAKRALLKRGLVEESTAYDFFPETFMLPSEYLLFVETFKKNTTADNPLWIMKPIGRCQGEGIFLFDKLSQISEWKVDSRWKSDNTQAERYVVQQYIASPMLIGGKKFDLRLYVLVTSYSPLTVFVCREGFARFSSGRYTMALNKLGDNYTHLTNTAIQKKGSDYDPDSGNKWDIRSLRTYLNAKHGHERVNKMFSDIQNIFIRSLQSVEKIMINDKNCFALYGFDILLDSQLKPWLLEINAAPSLVASTPDDYALKFAMLTDALTIIDLEKRLIGDEDQVGGWDLVYRGSATKFDPSCTCTSYLGCYNDRKKQLSKLGKTLRRRQREKDKEQGDQAGGSSASAAASAAASAKDKSASAAD